MIRGMGLYTPDQVVSETEVRSWQQPGDGHPEPALRALREQCRAVPDGFAWVGLFEPTRAELELVRSVFGLPGLQVEDAANQQQRAKFEIDDDGYGFTLFKTLDFVAATSDVHTGQISVFIGPDYAITVRFGQIGDLRHVRKRLVDDDRLRAAGSRAVLYAVLDMAVDSYVAVADAVSNDVAEMETEVFSAERRAGTTTSIYRLKRENVEIRRAVAPLTAWAHLAVRREVPWVQAEFADYFRDVGDHLLHTVDSVDATDSLLMAMLMASTSLQDLQQNKDMRKISAWVAIAAVPTAIAGIYGMNFDDMPELHWRFGYLLVLGLMATACTSLYVLFRRSGWL